MKHMLLDGRGAHWLRVAAYRRDLAGRRPTAPVPHGLLSHVLFGVYCCGFLIFCCCHFCFHIMTDSPPDAQTAEGHPAKPHSCTGRTKV